MADTLAGFPFWKLQFDESGTPSFDVAGAVSEIAAANLTDLFIFSHGWNNDPTRAMILYTGFFGEVRKIIGNPAIRERRQATIGVAGVIWPSILFPGDTVPDAGGAASFSAGATLESELPKIFSRPGQQAVLQDLLGMIRDQPADNGSLLQFRDKLRQLVSDPASPAAQDNLELHGLQSSDDEWLRILDAMSVQAAPDDSGGGAASFGDLFGRAWSGAQNVLRVATYWEMKNRAGVIGKTALGPLIGQVHAAAAQTRIHLLGHSFGARLVSYSLEGLPALQPGAPSPVKTLFLIQGAFSHFAFADSLPFDSSRKGDLAGMAARVDGPLLTTSSLKDLAVGSSYPIASVVAGQDASAATDLMYRWEGMGHDGAQAVDAASAVLGNAGSSYPFQTGKWLNLDGNSIIVNGAPPAGAHSDIVHPEIAWAALAAAGIG